MTTVDDPAIADTVAAVGGRDLAHYDDGTLRVPTSIPGLVLTFTRNQVKLTDEQMHLLTPLGIEADWDVGQVAVFLLTCHQRGLDPWRKQAYLLLIDSKLVYHIGIDGHRARAEATGQYRGKLGPLFCGPDGVWHDKWLDRNNPPAAAKVAILRQGFEPVWAVAMYDEYAPIVNETVWADTGEVWQDTGRPKRKKVSTGKRRPAANWRAARDGGKPAVMLEKVAKAAAFRDAFPEQCGGFYDPAETEKSRYEASVAAEADPAAPGEDAGAQRRHAAYEAAMTEAAKGGEFPAFAGLGVSDEGARPLLLAELDEQAAILDKTRTEVTAKWSKARGGADFATWPVVHDMASLVRALRPYVLEALREQGKTAEADHYEQSPDLGTVEELFGRSSSTIAGELVDSEPFPWEGTLAAQQHIDPWEGFDADGVA